MVCITIVSASGSFMPTHYLDPWDPSYAGRFTDPRVKIASQALLAPNGHNMQPWIIKLDPNDQNVFYLFGDPDRKTSEIDPLARQFTISQGAFLEYARLAAQNLGYTASIMLFPAGEYDTAGSTDSIKQKPVAKVILSPKTNLAENPLQKALFLPDTNRAPYQADLLTAAQIKTLNSLNTDQAIKLQILQDKTNVGKIKPLARQAMEIETGVHRINALNNTLLRVNEYQKNSSPWGFSLDSQGSSGIMLHITQALLTVVPSLNSEASARDLVLKNTRTALDNTPAYLMISSTTNTRTSQVKTGMLYSRLVLTAQNSGLVMQPLSQCLEEYPEMKECYMEIYQDFANRGETIQMLARIGKPTLAAPRSMRRQVMDLIQ